MEAVLNESWSVDQMLADVGVTREQLEKVVDSGEAVRKSCTRNDPRVSVGISVWGRMVRTLREQTIPGGWKPSAPGALETAVRGDGGVAISCATGDENTGIADGHPFTKYKKGPRTVEAVAKNQLNMFALLDPPGFKREAALLSDATLTWILLTHRAKTEIRYELSLPQTVGQDGRVTGWARRIILPPLPIDGDVEVLYLNEPDPEDIVVEIERKR